MVREMLCESGHSDRAPDAGHSKICNCLSVCNACCDSSHRFDENFQIVDSSFVLLDMLHIANTQGTD